MGIFNFGSKKKKLEELQSILMPDSASGKLLPEKELLRLAKQTVANDMRIVKDSYRIISKTKDKETFDSRINMMDECVYRINLLLPFLKGDVTQREFIDTYQNDKISMEWEFKRRMREELQKYSAPYFESIEKIEAAWSVLQTFKVYSGENAKSLEKMCKQSIKLYQKYVDKVNQLNPGQELPKHVPAFVRLAMLYEKQEKYDKAIDICVQAIQMGAYDDHSKGKMYGRLARMIKKSGIEVDDNIKQFMQLEVKE